jgi:hypothetical protein
MTTNPSLRRLNQRARNLGVEKTRRQLLAGADTLGRRIRDLSDSLSEADALPQWASGIGVARDIPPELRSKSAPIRYSGRHKKEVR